MSAVSAITSAGPSSLSTVQPIGVDFGSTTSTSDSLSAAPTGVPGVGQDYTDTSTSSTFILSSIGAPSQGGGDATGVLTIQTSPPEQVTATTAGTGGGGVVATPARTATTSAASTASTNRTSSTSRSSARSSGSSIVTAGTSNRPPANSSSAAVAITVGAGGSKAKVLALGVLGMSFLLGAAALY